MASVLQLDLEGNAIDNSQLSIYSTTDDVVTGSALAFLQGLYPPVAGSSNASTLANGTTIEYPLSGYQYPNVQTLSGLDPNSIWLDGHSGCPAYLSSGNAFADSAYSRQLYAASLAFYQTTFRAQQRLGLASAGDGIGMIRAVAGRTLAGRVVAQLSSQIASAGSSDGKLNPRVRLARAVPGLLRAGGPVRVVEQLRALPAGAPAGRGYSSALATTPPPPPPPPTRATMTTSGCGSCTATAWTPDAPLEEYPLLFGGGGGEGARVRWADFRAGMGAFAIKDMAGWCRACGAVTLFCIALDADTDTDAGSSSVSVSPAVAGVIGAATAAAFVLGGVRQQQQPGRSGARHARVGSWELGGPGPAPTTGGGDLAPQQKDAAAAFFGASVQRKADDGDDDVDSIMGRAPIKPLESI
ncbi:histidine phosphatase superfamily [Biscogniauxia mediterranea]|nr:histidine phosphatase superfamily [Biscogniauxia mediterranea]